MSSLINIIKLNVCLKKNKFKILLKKNDLEIIKLLIKINMIKYLKKISKNKFEIFLNNSINFKIKIITKQFIKKKELLDKKYKNIIIFSSNQGFKTNIEGSNIGGVCIATINI